MNHIDAMKREMVMVTNMDSRIPQDALRLAFCMGAMSTLPMTTKDKAKAAQWLGDQFEQAMMAAQVGGNA